MYSDYINQKNLSHDGIIEFVKMHGLGNDFVIIDQRDKDFKISPETVRKICTRNFGVGCDQLIILRSSDNFDCQMLIFNPDGSIARACGNACRCVAKLLNKDDIKIQIHDRAVTVKKVQKVDDEALYSVNIGEPLTEWYEIPLRHQLDGMNIQFDAPYKKVGACVNVGNPHLVFFESEELDAKSIEKFGSFFEKHHFFPDRINVSFAKIIDNNRINLQVWERGTGPTFACGTAACATHFIAYRKGLVNKSSIVNQRGGNLEIDIEKLDNKYFINMTGEAKYIFKGSIDCKLLA